MNWLFITVSIRDKTGSVVPTANHKIKCKLEGEGKIVATDNGDPTSLISFSATERETFNGFMLVVIKAHQGAKGKLRLIVESENLKKVPLWISTYYKSFLFEHHDNKIIKYKKQDFSDH